MVVLFFFMLLHIAFHGVCTNFYWYPLYLSSSLHVLASLVISGSGLFMVMVVQE